MDISLTAQEIKFALEAYVQDQGIETQGKKVEITLKSGRRKKNSDESSGHSALVVITAMDNIDISPQNDSGNSASSDESLFDAP